MTLLAAAPVGRSLLRLASRILVGIAGGTTVLVGLALVPLPGPGSLIVFLGISLLGREFAWARRLSSRVRRDIGRALTRCTSRSARAALGAFAVMSLVAPLLLLPR